MDGVATDVVDRLVQLGERLSARGKFSSTREWMRASGVSESYLSVLRHRKKVGQEPDVQREQLDALAKTANVSVAWLSSGVGSIDDPYETERIEVLTQQAAKELLAEHPEIDKSFLLDMVFEYGEKGLRGADRDDVKAIMLHRWQNRAATGEAEEIERAASKQAADRRAKRRGKL